MNPTEATTLENLRGRWTSNEPMARHVSWRAGGCVQHAYVPADLDDLRAMLRGLPPGEPVLFVGLGSNLLVRDGGLRGTVVFTHGVLRTIALRAPDEVYAEAGVASPKVARFAAMHDLIGAEFLAGIPGTVGGALAMNAGCYGGETWEVVRAVTTLRRDGSVRERTARDYAIDYRHVELTAATTGAQEWFVAARFGFTPGAGEEARQRIKEFLARRIATQPLNLPNAGSVFRNPPRQYAARLIEQCGLKGARQGGAVISEKHANFIVNTGGASAADIEFLIESARAAVMRRHGVVLECEVCIVGERA